jgi:hypothetical protein
MLCVIPSASEGYNLVPWIDTIALEVKEQTTLTKHGNFDPDFERHELVSDAAAKGDFVPRGQS